ncbi:ABC transporter substrate-binding protein [bacterium]|nr:ABC transporter substrate-binding protein [bacterium]
MVGILSRLRIGTVRLTAGLAGLALMSACEMGTSHSGMSGSYDGAPVAVALLVPSGSGEATDDLIATGLENAARMAIADLGNVKIDLRVYPTAANPDTAAAMATKAVDEGAKIILGPFYALEANKAGAAVKGRGIDVLAFSNNTAIAGGNVFILGQTFDSTASRLASYAVSKGLSRIMIVSDQNAAGEAGKAAIRNAITAAGGTVAAVGSYEFSQNGIVQAVTGIAASAKSSGAQALFLTADTGGALPLLTQLLTENGAGPTTTQYIGLTRWDIPTANLTQPGVQGGWFALPDPNLAQQFLTRYQSVNGAAPHATAGLAYDGMAAIGALIKQGGPGALNAQGLTQGAGFVGVNGIFRFLSDGTNQRGLAVAQIVNQQVTLIDPAPRAFGGAGY